MEYRLLRWFGHQNWIRFGIRNRLLRALLQPDRIQSCEFQTNYFGLSYHGNLNNYIDWMIYFFGAYERQTLFLLRDLLQGKQHGVFLDVGANIGAHSLFMSKYAGSIHSFEPYELVRSSLETNVSNNAINNITIHPYALGNRSEEILYYAPTGFNMGTGSFVESHDAANNAAFMKLKVVKGDDYLAANGIEHINLIKIDVEGFEKSVLEGLKDSLKRFRPIVFMEYSELTKNTIGTFEGFMELFPENYTIQKFNSNDNRYWLSKFDFNSSGGDIVLIPCEVS